MSLTLGKSFDRCYNLRLSFLDGFYNIGVFFNKRSPFLLFRIDPDFIEGHEHKKAVKINMFKNLEASKFCETFLNLHSYRKQSLDILNQFESIKSDYHLDVNFLLNETITLTKVQSEDKVFYDNLILYGFFLTSFPSEFVFLVAERQSLIKKLRKKIVRTTAIQIATSPALELLKEFYEEAQEHSKIQIEKRFPTDEVIKLNDLEKDI